MAAVDLAGLLRCLEVTETTPGSWAAPNLEMDYHRIFGGQLLAQAIMLATATVEVTFEKNGDYFVPLFKPTGST